MPGAGNYTQPLDVELFSRIMREAIREEISRIIADFLRKDDIPDIFSIYLDSSGSYEMSVPDVPVLYAYVDNLSTADVYLNDYNGNNVFGKVAAGTVTQKPIIKAKGKIIFKWTGSPNSNINIIISKKPLMSYQW